VERRRPETTPDPLRLGRHKTTAAPHAEGLDVYNTILAAHGATRRIGPADRKHQEVSAIRA
jgi:hypothetical protein